MLREIVFDTETTGLDPLTGDRLVEIGCIELMDRFPTGRVFHKYVNPQRDMPIAAFNVHGLSESFLSSQPCFVEIVDELVAFIGEETALVAHNAMFDLNFLNAELTRAGRLAVGRERLVDTLMIARRKHAAGNGLDELCKRYGVDNARRTKHGALLDAELLAEVYLELLGARQAMLGLAEIAGAGGGMAIAAGVTRQRPSPLSSRVTPAEREAHLAFIATLKEPLWAEYRAG